MRVARRNILLAACTIAVLIPSRAAGQAVVWDGWYAAVNVALPFGNLDFSGTFPTVPQGPAVFATGHVDRHRDFGGSVGVGVRAGRSVTLGAELGVGKVG